MALDFTNAITDRVNCGSDVTLDDLLTGTYMVWVYPTAVNGTTRSIIHKGAFGTGYRFLRMTNGDFFVGVRRLTTNLRAESNTTPIGANSWQFLAGVHDTGGVNGDQRLFYGTLTSLVAEVGGYVTQTVGAGVVPSNAATDQMVGNNDTPNAGFSGHIAIAAIWNRMLSLGELQAQQFRPHPTNGCVLFLHLGYNLVAAQPDWSGNGNNGVVVGATLEDHVPLGPPFGFDLETAGIWEVAVPPVGQPTMIRTQGVPTGPGYKDRVKKWNF